MNKQQLANKIWAAANKMRSKIEANEYKDYILGFIFYKFLSDKEETKTSPACACNGNALEMEADSIVTGCGCGSLETSDSCCGDIASIKYKRLYSISFVG